MKSLILMRGLPGAGKTSTTDIIRNDYPAHSADDYFYENGTDTSKYEFDPSKLGAAHKQCQRRTEEAIVAGAEQVFVANTFTTDKEIKPYRKLAEKHGYRLITLIVENRHGNKSVHNVPADRMDIMETRFTYKLR